MSVNALLKAPDPPGSWVNESSCLICGETYEEFEAGISWNDGVVLVRSVNEEGGGYRSRGPVLWAMRVQKLQAWYERHTCCGMEG